MTIATDTDAATLNGYVFDTTTDDSVPQTDDVEYPCDVCGKEAGPYAGKGRKPTKCSEHKKGRSQAKTGGKVTGNAASLAAQAATVLEQLNGIMAVGLMAVGFNSTASAIAAANDGFKEQAYQALTTDADLCRLILKSGVKSGKVSLALAYASMSMQVVPVAVMEYRVKQEAKRQAAEEAMADLPDAGMQ